MNMDFNPKHVTVMTNDNTIMIVSIVSPQSTAGSVNSNVRRHVGLHWAPIQLSVNLTEVTGDFIHDAMKSLMLVLLDPATICVDSQVPLCTWFLLDKSL